MYKSLEKKKGGPGIGGIGGGETKAIRNGNNDISDTKSEKEKIEVIKTDPVQE